jgi:hypothetical protein
MGEDLMDDGFENDNVALDADDIPDVDDYRDLDLECEFRFGAERARWGCD